MGSVLNAQIDRLSVTEQAYNHLRSGILSGEIPQGMRVIEAQIARSLNISRAPLREAVNRLVQEGLLESNTHYGSSVIQMTPEKIRHLYELRVAIESLAIRHVVRRRDEIDLAPLRDSVAEMRQLARKKDLAGVVAAELKFHQILCDLAGNPYVAKVSAMIDAQARLALTIDNSHYANLKDVVDEHEPIIAVIESGDSDAAADLITAHILSSLAAFESGGAAGDEVAAAPRRGRRQEPHHRGVSKGRRV